MILSVLIIVALCAFLVITYIPEQVLLGWPAQIKKTVSAIYLGLAAFLVLTAIHLVAKAYGVYP
jgi:hypothetical protein